MEKEVYLLDFTEQLDTTEDVIKLDSNENIMNANVDVVVDMGKTWRTIREIKDLKVDDYLVLDKLLDEGLSINVNGSLVGYGENALLDGKLGVNILKFKK